MYHFECTESRGGPVVDLVLGGLYAWFIVDVLSDDLYTSQEKNYLALYGALWSGVLTTSGVLGLKKVNRCREARMELAERLAAAGPTDPVVLSVEIVPSELSLVPGEEVQLTATALNASGLALPGRTFSWTSSNSEIASVSPQGWVTGRAEGRVMIAANTGGVVGTAEVRVTGGKVFSPTMVGRER
jgi:hypothetical protein